jgi:hypothetical protein
MSKTTHRSGQLVVALVMMLGHQKLQIYHFPEV